MKLGVSTGETARLSVKESAVAICSRYLSIGGMALYREHDRELIPQFSYLHFRATIFKYLLRRLLGYVLAWTTLCKVTRHDLRLFSFVIHSQT